MDVYLYVQVSQLHLCSPEHDQIQKIRQGGVLAWFFLVISYQFISQRATWSFLKKELDPWIQLLLDSYQMFR